MRHESPAAKRIQKARTTLLLDHPFFGTLLFRLKGRETPFYNPAFVDALTTPQLVGVLAHEVLHPALQHHTRRGDRSPVRWNKACDFAINPLILDAGLVLPKEILIEDRFRGMSAERIYNLLEEEEESGSGQDSEDQTEPGQGDSGNGSGEEDEPNAPVTPGGIGQVLDAPEPADGKDIAEQAREWQIAVEQAETLAKIAGKIPSGLEGSLDGAEEAQVDWRELLRRSWSEANPADYSWSRPNRRHIWQGLYLPGVIRDGVGKIVIAVDCSGSVSLRQLSLFEAEIRSILEGQQPERVHVLYFDTRVHKVDVYAAGEHVSLNPVGGGGTDFRPCFDWVEEQQVQAQMLVFLMDLYGTLPKEEPSYPVLWASTGARQAPFGQLVPMQAA
jgi:predicted metal-dependent peptidase